MKLTMNAAISLMQGLASLDGYEKVYKDPSGVEKTIHSGYTFPAKTKLTIALNRKRLGEVVDVLNEQRGELFRELSQGNEKIDDPAKIAKFREQETEILKCEEEVNLATISVNDLRLDDANNQNISPSILIMISQVLSDFENDKKQAG